jgi:hypothetical protein
MTLTFEEARTRVEKLGFQLHLVGENYRVVTPQGGWHQSDDLECLMDWLKIVTAEKQIVTHREDRSIPPGRFYADLGYVDDPPEWLAHVERLLKSKDRE